jgi:hypothetical protein
VPDKTGGCVGLVLACGDAARQKRRRRISKLALHDSATRRVPRGTYVSTLSQSLSLSLLATKLYPAQLQASKQNSEHGHHNKGTEHFGSLSETKGREALPAPAPAPHDTHSAAKRIRDEMLMSRSGSLCTAMSSLHSRPTEPRSCAASDKGRRQAGQRARRSQERWQQDAHEAGM